MSGRWPTSVPMFWSRGDGPGFKLVKGGWVAAEEGEGCKGNVLKMRNADVPAAVAYFYQFEDVFCAFDVFLLKADDLDLLFPVLQNPQLSFTVQQVKHLQTQMMVATAHSFT